MAKVIHRLELEASTAEVGLIPALFDEVRKEAIAAGFEDVQDLHCEVTLTVATCKVDSAVSLDHLEAKLMTRLHDKWLSVQRIGKATEVIDPKP